MIARRALVTAIVAVSIGAMGFAAGPPAAGDQSRDGQNRRVRVHNQTGVVLQKLQAADVRTGEFGADLLDGNAVATGASMPVLIDDGKGGCLYDLRAELAGGQVLLRENINVCRIADYYLTR